MVTLQDAYFSTLSSLRLTPRMTKKKTSFSLTLQLSNLPGLSAPLDASQRSVAFRSLTACSQSALVCVVTHKRPLSPRRTTSQRGASHKYPRNEQRGANLAPLTAAHAMCCLLSTETMRAAMVNRSVRAKASFTRMLLGITALQPVRMQISESIWTYSLLVLFEKYHVVSLQLCCGGETAFPMTSVIMKNC